MRNRSVSVYAKTESEFVEVSKYLEKFKIK